MSISYQISLFNLSRELSIKFSSLLVCQFYLLKKNQLSQDSPETKILFLINYLNINHAISMVEE
ncbi:hypothetical protein BpHYR1_034436 [Brachionus plicatilis]|uniref:Uncharacterized protein n=1 Tax=Brachionus plicatilis TaxID=10195 RepID=A0A3M7T8J9_BRAPC|nr:hypothetical protein BpHYR1_034436 [Brachionus plicatilis]